MTLELPIEVVREQPDEGPGVRPTREVWRFWYYERRDVLVVDSYVRQFRLSKRHRKWYVDQNYERNSVSRHYGGNTTIPNPPLPDDVRDEALAVFVHRASNVRVVRFMGD